MHFTHTTSLVWVLYHEDSSLGSGATGICSALLCNTSEVAVRPPGDLPAYCLVFVSSDMSGATTRVRAHLVAIPHQVQYMPPLAFRSTKQRLTRTTQNTTQLLKNILLLRVATHDTNTLSGRTTCLRQNKKQTKKGDGCRHATLSCAQELPQHPNAHGADQVRAKT